MTKGFGELLPQQPLVAVESQAEVVERLRRQLPILPQEPDPNSRFISVAMQRYGWRGTDPSWGLMLAAPREDSGLALVTPANSEVEAALFAEAAASLRDNHTFFENITACDSRWWHDSPARTEVDTSLREVYRANIVDEHGHTNAFDILNCTQIDVSEEERSSIERAIQRVGDYTQGKIFGRAKGIVLCGSSHFSEDTGAAFHQASQVMRVDMDAIRQYNNELPLRYRRFFPQDRRPTYLQAHIGHELGHAMAPRTLQEVQRNNLTREDDNYAWTSLFGLTFDFSSFNNIPSWQVRVVDRGNGRRENVWRHDEAIGVELGEYPPTTYGCESPSEDEAESFCVDSQGGDMSSLQIRRKILSEMIANADSGPINGATRVAVNRVDFADGIYKPPRPLDVIKLQVYTG